MKFEFLFFLPIPYSNLTLTTLGRCATWDSNSWYWWCSVDSWWLLSSIDGLRLWWWLLSISSFTSWSVGMFEPINSKYDPIWFTGLHGSDGLNKCWLWYRCASVFCEWMDKYRGRLYLLLLLLLFAIIDDGRLLIGDGIWVYEGIGETLWWFVGERFCWCEWVCGGGVVLFESVMFVVVDLMLFWRLRNSLGKVKREVEKKK